MPLLGFSKSRKRDRPPSNPTRQLACPEFRYSAFACHLPIHQEIYGQNLLQGSHFAHSANHIFFLILIVIISKLFIIYNLLHSSLLIVCYIVQVNLR